MKSVLLTVAVLMSLICGCQKGSGAEPVPPTQQSDARSSSKEEIIVYVEELGSRADVFDLKNKNYSLRSKTNAVKGIFDVQPAFGGAMKYCSEGGILCLEVGLVVAVPAQWPFPSSWRTADLSCRQRPVSRALAISELGAECVYGGDEDRKTIFTFDSKKGITWYLRQCPECGADSYVLYTPQGLFAP